MKNLTTLLALGVLVLTMSTPVLGQVPRVISYQGILTDTTGVPKADGLYEFTFKFFHSESGGSPIWEEVKALEVRNGLFGTMLGDEASFPDSVNFTKAYWLGIRVDGTELIPRIKLGAVGYAFYALKADTATFVLNAGSVQRPISPGISSDELGSDAVTSSHIADGTISSADVSPFFLAPKADTAMVALMALSSSPTGIAGGDLTGTFPDPSIAADAVTSSKILDGTITGSDIAANSLSGDNILDGSITSSDLASTVIVPKADSALVASNLIPTANLSVASVTGNGSGLTNLDASALATGAVPDARVTGTYSSPVDFTNTESTFRGVFTGDGSGLTGIAVTGAAGGDLSGTFPNPVIADSAITTPKIANSAVTDLKILSLSASKLTGPLPGIDGSNLTSLDAGAISTGVLPNGRLSGSYSNALNLSSISNSFTGSGSGLTNLNASALSTGTVPNGRLSGSYSNQMILSNNENSFTGQYFDMTSIALGVILIKDLTEYEINPGESTVFLIDANLGLVTITLPPARELPRGTVYYFKLVGMLEGGVAIVPQEGEFIDLDGAGYELNILKTYVKLLSFDGAWYVLGGDGQLILPR